MLFQIGQAADGGPFAGSEYLDWSAQITLAASGTLAQGQVVCRDMTQISGIAGQVGTSATATNPDIVVLPSSSNAGRNYGVYQGSTIVNGSSTSTLTLYLSFRRWGLGLVLASAVETSGTAVEVGSTLITQPGTSNEVIVGASASGVTVGMAVATPINTSSASSVAAGSHSVTPVNPVGITTSTPLIIDAGTPVQETVTPSAVATNGLSFTATFANAHNAGFTIQGSATAKNAVLVKVPTATGDLSLLVYCDISI